MQLTMSLRSEVIHLGSNWRWPSCQFIS
jgi:hypothetical protein